MLELGANRYGKSQIHLVKVTRGAERHTLRDLTVAIALEGDFEAAHNGRQRVATTEPHGLI